MSGAFQACLQRRLRRRFVCLVPRASSRSYRVWFIVCDEPPACANNGYAPASHIITNRLRKSQGVRAHAPVPLDNPLCVWGIVMVRADVVELVDTLDSGSSGRKPVGVRVSPSAPHGGVAQLVRATGSYPVGRRFESARRYQPEFEFKSARYTSPTNAQNRRVRWVWNASNTPCLL